MSPLRLPLLLALATALPACGSATEPRPNLLLISIDTLRADHLGFYGYEPTTSPNLDAFAERSVVFDKAISPTGWTLPALASFMTSAYSSTHGCWFFTSTLDPSFTTLAEMLRDAGYDTAAVASHVYQGMRHGLHQGFTHYDDELVRSEQEWKDAVNSVPVSDKGVWWIEQKAAAADGVPWMLWLHYFDPHYKYIAQEPYTETFGAETEAQRYDTEIAYTDEHLGRVFAALEETGLDEDTLVVFFSDHGEEFYDHGAIGHSHSLYQELVRVPLVIGGPGIEPGRVAESVRTIDVLPTVLELLGVEAPVELQGLSAAPLMRGERDAGRPAVSELRVNWNKPQDSLVLENWKLIRYTRESGDRYELFDLSVDPAEQDDLAETHPDVVERLVGVLDREVGRARDAAEPYGLIVSDPGASPTELRHLQDLGYAGEDR